MNNDRVKERLNNYSNLKYFYGPDEGKIGAINRDINYLDDPWEILVNFSDDMRFTGFGWDVTMINEIRKVWPSGTDFFANFWDGYVPVPLPTMSIMGREYYFRDAYIYHPSYKSFSCDAEAMYVAQMRERYNFFKLTKRDDRIMNKFHDVVLFKHEHPTWLHSPTDETYDRNATNGDNDVKVYHERMEKYFYVNNPKPHTIHFDPIAKLAVGKPDSVTYGVTSTNRPSRGIYRGDRIGK